jgi:hypothetical protein
MMQAKPRHPGSITYVDGDADAIVAECPVAEVPESGRFVDTDAGPVPVVRVVATTAGDQRLVREYGPKGELLRTTLQVRPTQGSVGGGRD